ncbi:MAG: hypothetical protein ACRDKW_16025 [Actinomycetota bacterium]
MKITVGVIFALACGLLGLAAIIFAWAHPGIGVALMCAAGARLVP